MSEKTTFSVRLALILLGTSCLVNSEGHPGVLRKILETGPSTNVKNCRGFTLRGCKCTQSLSRKVIVTCRATLYSFPSGLPSETKELTLDGNYIQELTASNFNGLEHLEELSLDGNNITSVDFSVFSGLNNLTKLSLQNNNIKDISSSQGKKVHLKGMFLGGNHLTSVDFSVFYNMNKLKILSLPNNKIKDLFTSRRKQLGLEKIDLRSNALNRLGPNAFPSLQHLQQVNLMDNNISVIAGNTFETNKKFELNLRDNPLRCDCNMKRFRQWLKERNVRVTGALCQDGLDLMKRTELNPCDDSKDTDSPGSDEKLTCYFCENSTSQGKCKTKVQCQAGQSKCWYGINTLGTPPRYSKGCWEGNCPTGSRNNTDCLHGVCTVACCDTNLCNRDFDGPPLKGKCSEETTDSDKGEFHWPATTAGSTQVVSCPGDVTLHASRECVEEDEGEAEWNDPDEDECPEISEVTKELVRILDEDITDDNVEEISAQVVSISQRGQQYTSKDVDDTVTIIRKMLTKGAEIPGTVAVSNIITSLDNMFHVPEESLVMAERKYKSAKKFIETIDGFGNNLFLVNGVFQEFRPNLAIVVLAINQSSFRNTTVEAGRSLSRQEVIVRRDSVEVSEGAMSKDTITLPQSLFSNFNGVKQPGGDRAHFTLYGKDMFFQAVQKAANISEGAQNFSSTTNLTSLSVNSRVLSVSIGNLSLANLKDPVTLTFLHQRKGLGQPRCVFWNNQANSTQEVWSGEGCEVKKSFNDNYTVCQCYHLTNFALLMDVYGSGAEQTPKTSDILTLLSFVGCTLSFFGLCLTIAIYCLFSKLRRDVPSKLLLNLCVALACTNITFIISIYSLDNPALCKAIAVLMHFFLLSSMAWMSVEAFYMYLALVLVFRTYIHRFMLKSMLVGWGVPLVIVAITLGVNNTDNYGSQTNDRICWLSRTAFFVAFLGPVALVMLGNSIIFGLVIRQICGMSSSKLNKSETVSAAQQLRGIVGVFILLGITWIFAIFAIGDASLVFQYLFTICNSLQGLFIFVFYCLMKKDVQKTLFCCCVSTPDRSSSSQRSTKATYRTSGFSLKSAVNAVLAVNMIKKRGSKETVPEKLNGTKDTQQVPGPEVIVTPLEEKTVPPSFDDKPDLGVLY